MRASVSSPLVERALQQTEIELSRGGDVGLWGFDVVPTAQRVTRRPSSGRRGARGTQRSVRVVQPVPQERRGRRSTAVRGTHGSTAVETGGMGMAVVRCGRRCMSRAVQERGRGCRHDRGERRQWLGNHVAAAARTPGHIEAGEREQPFLPGRVHPILFGRFVLRLQVSTSGFELGSNVAAGKKTVMANLDEAVGEDVEKKAANELLHLKTVTCLPSFLRKQTSCSSSETTVPATVTHAAGARV